MGLVKCPDCGNMVSERAAACPTCGCPADAFEKPSNGSIENVGVVHKLELKSVQNVDGNFSLIDGKLDDKDNVFSPNYQNNNPVSIIDDKFRNPDGTLDDSHNVFSPNYQKQANADANFLIAKNLAQPMCKFLDRADLMMANQCVMNDLQNTLSVGRPISFISADSKELIEKVAKSEFVFPYVIVTALFNYATGYRKFTLAKEDGRTYQRYYDIKNLPSHYAPQIEVISDNVDEANKIVDAIKEFFKEPKTYKVPYLGGVNDSISFTCEVSSIEKTKDITDAGNILYINKTVKFKQVQWASFIDEEVNPNQNKMMDTYRKVQLAQIYLNYATTKDEYESQLTLYERLFLYVSKIRGAFGPWQTDEYKTLRNNVQTGQPFDADLVDKAFPDISLIYHTLPNDINKKENVANIRQRISDILEQYKTLWEKTCIDLNLPEDFTIMEHNVCVRDDYGLGWIINALQENVTRSIDDVIDEIKVKAREAAIELEQQEQYEAQMQAQYESQSSFESRDSSPGILSSVLTTAAGVALGNKITGNTNKDNGRKDFMGSAGCQIGKKDEAGFRQSCDWTCPLWHNCSRGR